MIEDGAPVNRPGQPSRTLRLDPSPLAFAGVGLYVGHGIQRLVPPLARVNIPAPVVGGLLVAATIAALRRAGHEPIAFDTVLQAPLMISFSASIV